jgi:hypothetical protein
MVASTQGHAPTERRSVTPKLSDAAEDSVARAVAAVDALLQYPDSDPGFEPDSAVSAGAAIERFAARFASADGWVKAVVEGARSGAEGLSGDRLQGLAEIVQNADDAGASTVRIVLDVDALLVAHDGRPVTLRNVFALATPWVTTKSTSASATGRFGIGLMTLQSLSPTLEVYSGHYRIRLGDPTIAVVDNPNVPDGFAYAGDTVLRVPLEPGVLDAAAIDEWFTRWDEAALLFCNHVKSITVAAGGHVVRGLQMRWEDPSEGIAEVGDAVLRVRRRHAEASDGRRWSVYTVDAPPPPGVDRARRQLVPPRRSVSRFRCTPSAASCMPVSRLPACAFPRGSTPSSILSPAGRALRTARGTTRCVRSSLISGWRR